MTCGLLLCADAFAQGAGDADLAPAPAADTGSLEQRVLELERAQAEAQLERERLKQRLRELEGGQGGGGEAAAREKERLERRIEELEQARVAQEDATRSIIAQSLVGLGSKINEFVDLGGVLELQPGWEEDFLGEDQQTITINTAELQLEIQATDWARGSLVVEYDAVEGAVFTTNEGIDLSLEKINIDTGFVTVGDVERFPPYARIGRMIVPFGISTGDPVADVLSIVEPLTVEVFETKADAILFGAEFPTPAQTPEALIAAPPAVKPQVVAPLVGGLARLLGYKPFPAPPPSPLFVPRPAARPPFRAGVFFYDGTTFEKFSREGEWDLRHHMGAMAGFRTKGGCRSYFEGEQSPDEVHWLQVACPWTLDLGVEWSRSVFDSDFLSSDYGVFIAGDRDRGRSPIGFVPGMATSLKTTLGPLSLVAEWNGALENASFVDDDPVDLVPRQQDKRPRAWQVSLGYQFDWNPSVESIGSQGTYLSLSYSASRDLGGAVFVDPENPFNSATRVGFVPKRRITVGAGEWVLPNLRLAIEYARAWDYSKGQEGTNKKADAVLSMVTFEW